MTDVLAQVLRTAVKANDHHYAKYKSPFDSANYGKGLKVPYATPKGAHVTTSRGSTHDGGGHSLLGGILSVGGNLAHDVKDTVTGIPGGLVHTVEHPIGTAKAVGKDYATRYSPLLHGHFGTFLHQVEQHPLSYILDAATIATAGGGLAAKVGQSARIADAAETARVAESLGASKEAVQGVAPSRLAAKLHAATSPRTRMISASKKAEAGDKRIEVVMPKNPVQRLRRTLGIKAQETVIPEHTPVIGLASRATKAAKAQQAKLSDVARAPERELQRHIDDLDKYRKKNPQAADDIAVVADHMASGVSIADHAKLVKSTLHSNKAEIMEKHGLDDEGFNQLVSERTKAFDPSTPDGLRRAKLQGAVNRRIQLDSMDAGLTKRDRNLLRNRTGRAAVKDADAYTPDVERVIQLRDAASKATDNAAKLLIESGHLTKDVADQRAVVHYNLVAALNGKLPRVVDKDATAAQAKAVDLQYARDMRAWRKGGKQGPQPVKVKAGTVTDARDFTPEEVQAAFKKVGLPAPIYNPDRLTVDSNKTITDLVKPASGETYAKGTRQTGELMNTVMSHQLASRASDLKYAHQLLSSLGRPLKAGEKVPDGFSLVRTTLKPTKEDLEALGDVQRAEGPHLGDDFQRALFAERNSGEGRIIVSDKLKREVLNHHEILSGQRATMVNKAVHAWKTLTLALRPAFATVNIGSNQIMFHLMNGFGHRAMAVARKEQRAIDEHWHTEMSSFGHSEMNKVGKNGKAISMPDRAANLLYKVTGMHEEWLRKLTAIDTAKRLPQVQAELRRLKGGKYDPAAHGGRTMFHEAVNQAIAKNPAIRDIVAKQMDDTLGNYRYYTAQERMLKGLSPFYGWERHSTRTFVRLFEDHPATAAMLVAISAQGNKDFEKSFGKGMPDFAKQYVHMQFLKGIGESLGLGNINTVDFSSLNPYTTALDVGGAAKEIATGGGKNRDFSSLASLAGPLVQGPIEEYTGKSMLTGAPVKKGIFAGGLPAIIERTVRATPPAQLATELATNSDASKKMLPQTRGAALARYFIGLQVRNPNVDVLRKVQAAKVGASTGGKYHKGYVKYHRNGKTYWRKPSKSTRGPLAGTSYGQ